MNKQRQDKRLGLFLLAFSAALLVFWQYPYFKEFCYDHDLSGYVYSALDVLAGNTWYQASCLPRPPGIHFIIIAAFNLFGQSFKSIYLAALFFDILSVVLIYLLSRLVLSKVIRLHYLLPLFFTLFFIADPFRAYTANTEVFALVFEITGILLLGLGQYLLGGLLFGLGFMIRQMTIANLFAGLFFIIYAGRTEKKIVKNIVKDIIFFTGAFLLPLILVSLYFLSQGVFDKFINYAFLYNLQNADNYLVDIRALELAHTNHEFWRNLKFEIILFSLFAFWGLLRALLLRNKIMVLISSWFIYVCLGLFFTGVYQHHFIQLIAPMACLGFLGLSDILNIAQALALKRKNLLRGLTSVLYGLLIFAGIHLSWIFLYERRIFCKYFEARNDRFQAAIYVKERTTPEDKIFVWDELNTGSIILWSGRANLGRFHEKYAYLPPPLRAYWNPYVGDYLLNQKEFIADFKLNMPKYVIFVWEHHWTIGFNELIKDRDLSGLGWNSPRQIVELEKEAFSEFFEILSRDYVLEKKIDSCRIYRRRY